MPRVSVIIPVYNSGKFLRECIDSLLVQTEKDCEFIFVNDGSTDDSRDIIVSRQQTDDRIHVINQANHGVSVARNNGIAAAKGEFLSFVDADDTIKPDMLETLYKIGSESGADIVVSNFIRQQDGRVSVSRPPFETGKVFSQGQVEGLIFPYMLQYDGLNPVANKMYRREPIAGGRIVFPEGQKLGEDAIFNFKAMANTRGVIFTDYAGYYYREVIGSATRNIIEKDYFRTALDVYHFNYRSIVKIGISDKAMQEFKGLRLIDKIISYAAIYHKPNAEFPEKQRRKYVSGMISHPIVQENVKALWPQLIKGKSLFDKFILYCIKYRLMALLWTGLSYSYHRNKK